MDPLDVDGSHGEGGGQILRTAAAFAIALHKPIRVTKIRAGRELPGLRQQHVSALQILRAVSGGVLEGCSVGSSEIEFRPGTTAAGSLSFDLKTAASITLVLQAVVPAVGLSGTPLSLELVGGTDVPWSPTFDYFANVVRTAFSMTGLEFQAEATSRGYYPKGGGRVKVSVAACGTPKAVTMLDSPRTARATIMSRCGSLPEHVARRQMYAAREVLGSKGIEVAKSTFSHETSLSPGSSVAVWHLGPDCSIGADSIGARGKRAEEVGAEAGERFASAVSSGACIDSNLSDMLVPILALAVGESRIRIPGPTKHLETNLYVAQLFTGCAYSMVQERSSTVLRITPSK